MFRALGSYVGYFGGQNGIQDHLRGCALASDERVCCDEDRGVQSSSSAISIMASPDKVVSVFVGDAGD